MDKFTQLANEYLKENMSKEFTPTQKSADIESLLTKFSGGKNRRAYILAGKCIITNDDAGPFRDELSKKEYEISGIGQKAQDIIFRDDEEESCIEDQETETELEDPLKDPKTKQGLEAIKLAAKLGVGPARNIFQRGEQQLAGAMSRKYGELAKIINSIKLN